MREDTADYRQLFLDDVPLLDVRAPVEFVKGAFPGAVNLPLISDQERQKVGTCYKQHGQQAAIELGQQLVSGRLRAARIEAWRQFAETHPDGYLYCFRGGLRSQIVQQWLAAETGLHYPRVQGGYKAMRNFLLETMRRTVAECAFVVVGGMTGTGKTEVIQTLDNALDLEHFAHHRGSSFGKQVTAQPAQIDFENRLAIAMLRQRQRGIGQFVVEDEARLIGRCSLPLELHQGMQHCPLVWLEDSLENRIERILRDYVIDLCGDFVARYGAEQGFQQFSERLRDSLGGIARRLGGERYKRFAAIMDRALLEQQAEGRVDSHRGWISGLLNEYYDPMYAFQRESKSGRILFAGEKPAVIDYLREYAGCTSAAVELS